MEPVRQAEARETALPPAPPGRQWWRALKAIVRLAVHTEDTTQVFEIIHALAGDGMERTAYRRGTRAQFLVATPMEQLLPRPIDAARRALDVSLPLEAHPDGILTGSRAAEGIGRGPPVRPI